MMGYKGSTENIKGPSELDIVRSGLDDIMSSAVIENWNYSIESGLCFRDACLVRAITKVYDTYVECGFTV